MVTVDDARRRMPARRGTPRNPSMSPGRPERCTTRTASVRLVTAVPAAAGSRLLSSGLTSANTGVATTSEIAFAVA
jgi:hypothetical protein